MTLAVVGAAMADAAWHSMRSSRSKLLHLPTAMAKVSGRQRLLPGERYRMTATKRPLQRVVRQVCRAVGLPGAGEASDGQLLERFVAQREELAFDTLVHRHGPMVWGLCRRLLHEHHAAEDAFQATFLVLLRKAHALDRRPSLGSWLYGVAYRVVLTARKARADAARRHDPDVEVANMPVEPETDTNSQELRALLDAELHRLPEKYRAPLVLCCLEGKTNEQAARELGWPAGSMSRRLARGRELLRQRLARQGITFLAAGFGLALAEALAPAAMPSSVADSTLNAAQAMLATGMAITADVASPAVADLTQGALKTMTFSKLKGVAGIVGAFLVLAGSGLLAQYALRAAPPATVAEEKATPTLAQATDSPQAPAKVADKPADAKPMELKPLDAADRIEVKFGEELQRFGISLTKLKDPRYPDKPKLLLRNERGNTNNTAVRIDKKEYIFGRYSIGAGVVWAKEGDKEQKGIRVNDRKWFSRMEYGTEKILITQTVEIVVGEQTLLYDTALVTYQIENADNKAHAVGLRVMLDTYIGLDDGVPFLVPPTNKAVAQLVDTKAELEKDKIPPVIWALESPNLDDATNVVAEMGLKLKGLDPIDKLVICRWPQDWGAAEARWNWPYEAINKNAERGAEKDSCVVLYWDEKELAAGAKRVMGFTYGLGRVADGKNGDKALRLFAGGSSRVGGSFVISAYVKDPKAKQKVSLQLPPELALAESQQPEQEAVQGQGQEYAQVSWRVQPKKVGKFTIKAEIGNRSAAQEVLIRESSRFE